MCVCVWAGRVRSTERGYYFETAELHRLGRNMLALVCPLCAVVAPGCDLTRSPLADAALETFRDIGQLKRHLTDKHGGMVVCEVCFR
jgi:hypothetical protein